MQYTNANSKAQVLQSLVGRLTKFAIPKFIYFKVADFSLNREKYLYQVRQIFDGNLVAIRSSAMDEDGLTLSMAGKYKSILNVPSNNKALLTSAIMEVIDRYLVTSERANDCEVIVQEMLSDISMSGVVFTHDLNTGAPYYVINYDDVSGLSNTVTSGDGEYSNRTLYIYRGASQDLRSKRFESLIYAVEELENVIGSQFLDIEFVIDRELNAYLLQARPITTTPNWNRSVANEIDGALQGAYCFLRTKFNSIPGIYGATTVLGQMPDWNPAEMIGRAPRSLAFSLYKYLITDEIWSKARFTMGYQVPSGHPLMIGLCGQPFIDVRLSLNSFLPDHH